MGSSTRRIEIFDTTLRDGEQSPGVSLNATEKLEIARQLEKLRVDVIEAGFPIASQGDFDAVRQIAREVREPVIAALARAHKADISRAAEALRDAERPRIHTFVSTSDIHIEHQMASTRDDVKGLARAAVAHARSIFDDVEFSPMDATRADAEFTAEVIAIAIEEGATVINVPDTVGYATPREYAELLTYIHELPALGDRVKLSVHCHDDLGLAVANSLAGVAAGATQVECSVNGIGERAGNCSLEELVMALRTRSEEFGADTDIDSRELARTSRLVSRLTGYPVAPNKAIVGANAFAHESGIHQDGVLKERRTFEIIDPVDVGVGSNRLVLGKHSGRHALKEALADLGHQIEGARLNEVFRRFKSLADRKKTLTSMDLEALVDSSSESRVGGLVIESFEVRSGGTEEPHAQVVLRVCEGPNSGETVEAEASGDGTMDALFAGVYGAVTLATGSQIECRLARFNVESVTEGADSLAQVGVVVEDQRGRQATGSASDPDTVAAGAEAYLRALCRLAA